MKTLRLIVSMRLAFFPLALNLSFAQEKADNNSGSVPMIDQDWNSEQNENEVEPGLNWEENIQDSLISSQNDDGSDFLLDKGDGPLAVEDLQMQKNETLLDSSLSSEWQINPENDNDVVPLYERGYGEAEGIFSKEEILSPSDSSFQKGAEEFDTKDFSPQTEWQDLPNLKITEVYRLWSTEWIEITNLSDKDFSWKLSLSWAKSSLYSKNLDIPSYTSVILADKGEIWLINNENLVVNNAL